MENFEIKIISCEVDRKVATMENVITHIIWQYSLEVNGITESLVYRTILNPPKKKGFVKITDVEKTLMQQWITEATDMNEASQQLREFHADQNNKETFIYIPSI